ncbi:MAG TPA: L,D-transpeptidase [Microvirga sp.]|jgi:lipoprotein-anchoring transpeptidase ErfK/SrfK|nr:L,D-transpeptidase [Microvirga sp.]
MITRRGLLGAAAAALLTRPAAARGAPDGTGSWYGASGGGSRFFEVARGGYDGVIEDEGYAIPVIRADRLSPGLRRQVVPYDGPEAPGTIVVDTAARHLFLVQPGDAALRYGIGVGKQGFAWSGIATVARKAKWPAWRPPEEMMQRRRDLPDFVAGGPANPLGARALYLFQGERDTLYRIHGTNEPGSIGRAVSSGCIRLLNQDVHDLYERVPVGSLVKVYGPAAAPRGPEPRGAGAPARSWWME